MIIKIFRSKNSDAMVRVQNTTISVISTTLHPKPLKPIPKNRKSKPSTWISNSKDKVARDGPQMRNELQSIFPHIIDGHGFLLRDCFRDFSVKSPLLRLIWTIAQYENVQPARLLCIKTCNRQKGRAHCTGPPQLTRSPMQDHFKSQTLNPKDCSLDKAPLRIHWWGARTVRIIRIIVVNYISACKSACILFLHSFPTYHQQARR